MSDLERWIDDYVRVEASLMDQVHATRGDKRGFVEGRNIVGMQGEFEFGRLVGQMPHGVMDASACGDGGIDFVIPLRFTVDVKTARKPYYLLHPVGDPVADIYVLAEYTEEMQLARQRANLLGWEWGPVLARAPVREFGGYRLPNNHIAREELRPMAHLLAHLRRSDYA